MNQLSENQFRILEFLKERSGTGIVPSVREICQAVGLKSTSSVQANLNALEEKGYIVRDPLLKRSIRIVGQAENIRHVPLLGVVTAGLPILAVEQIECYLPFTGPVSGDKEMFALRVRGESMLDAGIYDGDILFAEKTPTARNGDIVVAVGRKQYAAGFGNAQRFAQSLQLLFLFHQVVHGAQQQGDIVLFIRK